MAHTEKCIGCCYENACDFISCRIEENKRIKLEIRKEFAHELKEAFNNEFPSNYPSTKPFFTLENARKLVDEVLKQWEKSLL